MSQRPLRAGLSGCGGISRWTMERLSLNSDLRVVACQDPNADARRAFAAQYGIQRQHATFAELLAGSELDLVVLNSPNDCHHAQVEAAAAEGLHCLVQKPMARTAAEARRMLAATRRHGVRLGVVMMELADPLHHELREMLAAGFLGEPVLAHLELGHDLYLRTPPADGDWRRDPQRVGGSAFLQLGIHLLDLLGFLLDDAIVEVAALAGGDHTVFTDETTLALARLRRGALASLSTSYATRAQTLTVRGTEGFLRLDPQAVELTGQRPWQGQVLRYDRPGAVASFGRESLQEAIGRREAELEVHARFARWVRDGEPFPSPGEVALRDLRAADAVRQAVATGAVLRVPLEDES